VIPKVVILSPKEIIVLAVLAGIEEGKLPRQGDVPNKISSTCPSWLCKNQEFQR